MELQFNNMAWDFARSGASALEFVDRDGTDGIVFT
jgi:hypothetical protein